VARVSDLHRDAHNARVTADRAGIDRLKANKQTHKPRPTRRPQQRSNLLCESLTCGAARAGLIRFAGSFCGFAVRAGVRACVHSVLRLCCAVLAYDGRPALLGPGRFVRRCGADGALSPGEPFCAKSTLLPSKTHDRAYSERRRVTLPAIVPCRADLVPRRAAQDDLALHDARAVPLRPPRVLESYPCGPPSTRVVPYPCRTPRAPSTRALECRAYSGRGSVVWQESDPHRFPFGCHAERVCYTENLAHLKPGFECVNVCR
jgi:hypothetical protein